jgi:hypothetical protein
MNNLKLCMRPSLSNLLHVTIIVLFTIFLWGVMYFIVENVPQNPQKYDCSIAEISPDVPLKVKEECRKFRMIKQ